ncbi:glycosyltransferase family 4 protein [Salinibacter ruber]|uniref:glycosyltransferase family 4 protein n=1 Tax=Salinibacter ruber TaxID=146919 RepID=UPI002166DEC0|nr:glycosyltransferase family 4 protein [Salinibacter ruber]MCS3755666.1 glycosyltransferase involved in cell wall biosynthesis [Salinibacter ruber]
MDYLVGMNKNEDGRHDLSAILLVSHAFPPDVGGAQQVAVQNARMLSKTHKVEVLTSTNAPKGWDQRYDFTVTRVSTPFGVWPLRYARAFAARSSRSYRAVIFNDPAALYAAGLSAPSSFLKRGIGYLHGTEPELFFSEPKLLYRLVRFRHYFKRGLAGCRVILPVSKYMQRKFVEQTGLHGFQSKMSVAYAGVDQSVFYPDPSDIRDHHDIEDTADVLLSASRLVKQKGYDEMLQIFGDLCREGHSLHWIIAGDGPYRESLLQEVEREGLSDCVTWVGELTQDNLRQYYSAADAFWLLSKFREAFGLVYLEANACGTPVIGRDRGGVREAIQNGTTGFLVTNAEDCRRILANRRYQSLETEDVLDWAGDFGVKKAIQRLQKIIDQVACSTDTEMGS